VNGLPSVGELKVVERISEDEGSKDFTALYNFHCLAISPAEGGVLTTLAGSCTKAADVWLTDFDMAMFEKSVLVSVSTIWHPITKSQPYRLFR